MFVVALLTACGGGGGGGGSGSSSAASGPDPIPAGELKISGTISVSPALAVDMDTRDPRSADRDLPSNDLPYDVPPNFIGFDAQLIPSPGTVGGYVSFDGYVGGRITGDLHDFYRVSLAAGQFVSLQISDFKPGNPYANDFDLLLLKQDGEIVDFAADVGPIETINAPADAGEYIVLVTVCADHVFYDPPGICGNGRSNYTLTVGQYLPEQSAGGLRLSSEFAANEALVVYQDAVSDQPQADSSDVYSATASAVSVDTDRLGDVRRIDLGTGVYNAVSSSVQSGEDSPASHPQEQFFVKVRPDQQEQLATLAAIKSLKQQENVVWAEPNYLREPLFVPGDPDDPLFALQWHYPLINLPAAWNLGVTGANVTVAVLDTGILPFHPDLQGQIDFESGGYDFVRNPFYSLDGDGVDPDPTDPGDGSRYGYSSSFHGTHVAGTIAAATNNNIGVAGIAYNANILPVRVLGRGVGTSFDISQGLCFAAGLTDGVCAGVPLNEQPADIINLSLGGADYSMLEQQLIDEIIAADTLVVAAAGNSDTDQPSYPAAYDGVFSVSAVDLSSELAPYSNYGPTIDLAAPGGNSSRDVDGDGNFDLVYSTGGDDSVVTVKYSYPAYQGTSMAAPHVAGVFALMRSVDSSLDTTAIGQLLRDGELTTALGEQTNGRNDDFGYGLIDAGKAVTAALNRPGGGFPPEPVPFLGVVPGSLNFGATLNSLQLQLRNNSGGPLDILSIESDQLWLTAPPINGLGTYQAQIVRGSLPEESYAGTLTITSSENTVEVNVIMQVNNALQNGDAGHLYVRLIDPDTGNIRDVQADAVEGEYSWQINDLPSGNYQLVAFTDADNDGRVCDPGEACGSYLTTDQPILIQLQDDDLAGLDFPLSFGVDVDPTDPVDKPD
jgi:serine protease